VLAERGVVTLHANRGAFVSSPDAAEAHEVFEARRAVERPIVLLAAERIDAGMLAGLRANVRDGAAAEARGDRSLSIRLSGGFHLRLAEVGGNSVLAKFLGELVARTSLIIGVHGSHSARSCSEAEHQHLTDALERRDHPSRRGGDGAPSTPYREHSRHPWRRRTVGRHREYFHPMIGAARRMSRWARRVKRRPSCGPKSRFVIDAIRCRSELRAGRIHFAARLFGMLSVA
jgi:hypothetical protein